MVIGSASASPPSTWSPSLQLKRMGELSFLDCLPSTSREKGGQDSGQKSILTQSDSDPNEASGDLDLARGPAEVLVRSSGAVLAVGAAGQRT